MLGLLGAYLFLSTCSAPQEKPTEIKLTIKYNDRTVPNPDHITFGSRDCAARVPLVNGKFTVPAEILHARNLQFSLDIVGNRIQMIDFSQNELEFDRWTLYLADHHYKEHAYDVPKGAKIRSSCMLVLDSDRFDPGVVLFQTHCRSKVGALQ